MLVAIIASDREPDTARVAKRIPVRATGQMQEAVAAYSEVHDVLQVRVAVGVKAGGLAFPVRRAERAAANNDLSLIFPPFRVGFIGAETDATH